MRQIVLTPRIAGMIITPPVPCRDTVSYDFSCFHDLLKHLNVCGHRRSSGYTSARE
jgi:hypothetical protein